MCPTDVRNFEFFVLWGLSQPPKTSAPYTWASTTSLASFLGHAQGLPRRHKRGSQSRKLMRPSLIDFQSTQRIRILGPLDRLAGEDVIISDNQTQIHSITAPNFILFFAPTTFLHLSNNEQFRLPILRCGIPPNPVGYFFDFPTSSNLPTHFYAQVLCDE